jgi:subtilisin family serine protease
MISLSLSLSRALARGIFDLEHLSTGSRLKQLLRRGISEWSDLVAGAILQLLPDEESFSSWSHLNHSLSQHCSVYGTLRALIGAASHDDDFDFAERIKIEVYGNSVHIHGLPDPLISPTCVAVLAHSASLSPFVFSVSFGDDFGFVNADGSSSVQGDRMGFRAYHDAGLTGSGQIGGIADSGVNDLSCFFADNSEMYRTRSTSRTWGIESFRRKIIQYVPYADSVDDEGGHGTHTCGTLAGESLSVFSEENGVAPGAKIAFFDIGRALPSPSPSPASLSSPPSSLGYSMAAIPIMIPRLSSVLFPTAYAAGARVHSNSWAGGLTLYTEYSLEVDSYLYENPDFLVVLAAGNRGMFGPGSIGSPANSKNALCVGSTQIRNPVDDSLGSAGPVVSATSSLGPTFDGRIKPDILAVGEGVVSAYSTSVDLQYEAQHMRYSLWSQRDLDHQWTSLSSCSVHEKSGTSMATPLVAGSALLIRQYFSGPEVLGISLRGLSVMVQVFRAEWLSAEGFDLAWRGGSGPPLRSRDFATFPFGPPSRSSPRLRRLWFAENPSSTWRPGFASASELGGL